MDYEAEAIKLGTKLATIAARSSVETVMDRIRSAKNKGSKEEAINNLEEIINELISDKNELIQISKGYEEELIMRKMSDEDIEYITSSILPLFEQMLEESDKDEAEKMREQLEVLKPILSKETFHIMQLLGFNFKEAIGKPLTELLSSFITSNKQLSNEMNAEYNIINQQVQLEYLKISQDPDAYERFMKMVNK